jgi:predicted nucleic acid-binding protein
MGASYAIVSQLPSEYFEIALTVPLYLEYQDVLMRPENLTGTSSQNDIINFLRYLCGIAHQQRVFFLWRPRLADPEDDMVLEAAVASQSRYIVTYNLRHFSGRGIEEQFNIIPISPQDFLHLIKDQKR